MTKIISIEEIGLCRSGPQNDIDLEAVFGGIKGRQQKGLKVNPLYDNHGNNSTQNVSQDINGNIHNVHVVTYKSIPGPNNDLGSDRNGRLNHSEAFTDKTNGSVKGLIRSSTGPKTDLKDVRNGTPDLADETDSNGNEDVNVETNRKVKQLIETYKSISEHSNNPGVSNGTSNHVGEIDSNGNGNFSTEKDARVKCIFEIAGRNGSVKRQSFKSGDMISLSNGYKRQDSDTKSLVMPLHLKDIKENGNGSKSGNETEKTQQFPPAKLDKPSSSYQLLAYNNEGFVTNETDNDLETVTDISKTSVTAKDIVLNLETGKTQEVDEEIPSTIKSANENEVQDMNGRPVIENQHSVKSETPLSIESVNKTETCSEKIVKTSRRISTTSEQSVKTEIVTEVHVHRVEINQSPTNTANKDLSSVNPVTDTEQSENVHDDLIGEIQTVESFLQRETDENLQHIIKRGENITTVEVVSEVDNNNSTVHENHVTVDENKNAECSKSTSYMNPSESDNAKSVTFSTAETVSTNGYKSNTSSTRTLKSILLTSTSKQNTPPESPEIEHVERKESFSEIQECKSVTFSEDTVFNENKSKRHKLDKLEKINLREIYHGRISSDAAMAKINPLFKDESESPEGEKSMSEDERIAYQIALRKMMKSNKGKGQKVNTPAYRDHYLILKANGIRPSNIKADDLPDDVEQPAYNRLIQRTIAKERRKLIVKWTVVIIVVAIVTAVATILGVHFKENG